MTDGYIKSFIIYLLTIIVKEETVHWSLPSMNPILIWKMKTAEIRDWSSNPEDGRSRRIGADSTRFKELPMEYRSAVILCDIQDCLMRRLLRFYGFQSERFVPGFTEVVKFCAEYYFPIFMEWR